MNEADDEAGRRRREAIRDELDRLEESARYSAQGQFEQAKHWRTVNLLLGVPSAAIAAVAGATALASTAGRLWAGVLALVAAALGAVLTSLNASHRMNQASAAANAYLEIQTAARQSRLIDLDASLLEEARQNLAELTARRDEQNKTAEPPGRGAHRRAQKNLRRGGQDYAVDQSGRPHVEDRTTQKEGR